jgi:TolA-binding protein
MSRQIEALTSQLRALRGDIDELQHNLEQARASRKTSTSTSTRGCAQLKRR